MFAKGMIPALGIGEVASRLGLTVRAIRFYEERGLIASHRDRHNSRRYDDAARSTLELIAQLRRAGLAIPDIERLLSAQVPGGDLATAARRLVSARRQSLVQQLADLDAVDVWLGNAAEAPAGRPRRLERAS